MEPTTREGHVPNHRQAWYEAVADLAPDLAMLSGFVSQRKLASPAKTVNGRPVADVTAGGQAGLWAGRRSLASPHTAPNAIRLSPSTMCPSRLRAWRTSNPTRRR